MTAERWRCLVLLCQRTHQRLVGSRSGRVPMELVTSVQHFARTFCDTDTENKEWRLCRVEPDGAGVQRCCHLPFRPHRFVGKAQMFNIRLVQWLATLPHNKKVVGLNLWGGGGSSVFGLRGFPVGPVAPSHSPKSCVRGRGDSKTTSDVNVNVSGCLFPYVNPVMRWWWARGVPRLSPMGSS